MEVFSRHRAGEASSTWCASIHDVISVFFMGVYWFIGPWSCWFCCTEELKCLSVSVNWEEYELVRLIGSSLI